MMSSSGSSGIQKQAMDTASKSMPWRRDVPWWVILIQALILAGLGLFVLTNPASAGAVVILAAGVLLLVDGLIAVVGSLRGRHKGRAGTLNAVNAGIAIIVGVLVVIGSLSDGFMPDSTLIFLTAAGLIVTGGLSLVIALFLRNPGEKIRWLRVIGPLVYIGFGVLIAVGSSDQNDFRPLPVVGWGALLIGIVLFVLTYLRFQASRKEDPVAATAAPVASAPAPAPAPKPAAPPAPAPEPKPVVPPPPAADEPPANPS